MSRRVHEQAPRPQAASVIPAAPALGPGRPLEGGVRTEMERGLGHSFADVRIHDDDRGAALVAPAGAAAGASGTDVAFARGAYRPESLAGKALIAHELAHVAQHDPALPAEAGVQRDGAAEADADRAATAALAPGSGRRGVSKRTGGGLRLSNCNPEALRTEGDLLGEGNAATADINAQMSELGISVADIGRPGASATASGNAIVGQDALWTIEALQLQLHAELADARTDDQRRNIQRRYLEQLRRIRSAFRRQVELRQRWGIPFISGRQRQTFGVAPNAQSLRTPTAWTLEELNTFDGILGRMPANYVANARGRIDGFAREGAGGSAAADYNEATKLVSVYDTAFEHPDQLTRIVVHEIGHSTYQQSTRQVGAALFDRLPPQTWMALSDWRTSSAGTLATDLGVSAAEAQSIIAQLGGGATTTVDTNQFRGVPSNGRMVVADRYEPGGNRTRFFHYAFNRHLEFVSDYARSHPGEDLAESFAYYMQRPESLRGVSERKYEWMRTNHPDAMAADPNQRCT